MSGASVRWEAAALASAPLPPGATLPLVTPGAGPPMLPGFDLWDMWQLRTPAGATVRHRGRAIWFFLAAPAGADPNDRHDRARIRTLTFGDGTWRDLGPTFPERFTPGSREWSGSAVLDGARVTHYFTAAGRRDAPFSFEQRLFESEAEIDLSGEDPRLRGWSVPRESIAADGGWYRRADEAAPVAGRIKGFRDPGFFRDPADGADYLLFTGSAGWVDAVEDGVIGLARRAAGGWRLCPPLVDAVGTNSELERPHIVTHGGLLYLFWSTQRHRFAPAAGGAPTGLYGMFAETLAGPWRPLNGSGLVAANPAAAPMQAYCWWVTGELEVFSFVDLAGWAEAAMPVDAAIRRRHFGGSSAPVFRLELAGARAWPVSG